ncbi:uncharacterized protein J3R85_001743 [Psidium guajava]|nr:uncharacterized protein J3R85_001743 [Psidium guajava]
MTPLLRKFLGVILRPRTLGSPRWPSACSRERWTPLRSLTWNSRRSQREHSGSPPYRPRHCNYRARRPRASALPRSSPPTPC